jgi:hypothetical protein
VGEGDDKMQKLNPCAFKKEEGGTSQGIKVASKS